MVGGGSLKTVSGLTRNLYLSSSQDPSKCFFVQKFNYNLVLIKPRSKYMYIIYFLVYFLGIEENRRLARKHFHSRMRIFTKTRVTPDKDKDTPGDVILNVSTSPSINNSVLSLHHKTRGFSGTEGALDLTSEIMAEDSICNLNVPN